MNRDSLNRIEECIISSGKWVYMELSKDNIYLDFNNVELGNPNFDKDLSLTIRFGNNPFISFFYNNIYDVDYLSNYNFIKNNLIIEEFDYNIKNFKFLDFDYLDFIFNNYSKHKTFSRDNEMDIRNISSDFFLVFELDSIAICIGSNEMDFFNKFERLDDDLIMSLSNDWILYYLKYFSKRRLKKDKMCEKYPLK